MASSYAAAGEPVDKYALQLNALSGQIKEQKEVVAGLRGQLRKQTKDTKIAEKATSIKPLLKNQNQRKWQILQQKCLTRSSKAYEGMKRPSRTA